MLIAERRSPVIWLLLAIGFLTLIRTDQSRLPSNSERPPRWR
jgi:hypothetical protein